MKKIFLLLSVMILSVASLSARDKVYRDASVLPAPAKELLSKYFGKTKVSHINVDKKTFGGADYDVILTNGFEIEFNSDGTLTEIDCGSVAIPDALILKPIRDHVNKNFKGRKIVQMEVNRNSYDIELSDGTDLKFDRSGVFQRIDD